MWREKINQSLEISSQNNTILIIVVMNEQDSSSNMWWSLTRDPAQKLQTKCQLPKYYIARIKSFKQGERNPPPNF